MLTPDGERDKVVQEFPVAPNNFMDDFLSAVL